MAHSQTPDLIGDPHSIKRKETLSTSNHDFRVNGETLPKKNYYSFNQIIEFTTMTKYGEYKDGDDNGNNNSSKNNNYVPGIITSSFLI